MDAVTRSEQWYEAIVAELKSIKTILAELAELLKGKHNETSVS